MVDCQRSIEAPTGTKNLKDHPSNGTRSQRMLGIQDQLRTVGDGERVVTHECSSKPRRTGEFKRMQAEKQQCNSDGETT